MRTAFAGQLAEVEHRIHVHLKRAVLTLADVAEAVIDANPERTEAIARDGHQLRLASRRIDSDLVTITARQAPVASDLRRVIAMIQLGHHGGLIANQFGLISQHLVGLPGDVNDRQGTAAKLSRMAAMCGAQLQSAAIAFVSRDVDLARRLDRDDDAIDKLNRQIFTAALLEEVSSDQRERAVRRLLIARSLERIGDNAVDIAERTVFLVTAEMREFSDASRPRLTA